MVFMFKLVVVMELLHPTDSKGGSGAAVIGGKSNPFTFVTDHDTHNDFMGTATLGYTFSINKKKNSC
jgi:hypothetical protein